jgi:hypothetical protein
MISSIYNNFSVLFLFLQDQNVCEKIIIKWKQSDISTKSKDGWFLMKWLEKRRILPIKKK